MLKEGIWKRSKPVVARDHNGVILPENVRPDPIPEQRDDEPPCMSYILGWEYGRKWLERRDQIKRHQAVVKSMRIILPDFAWWVNQRRPLYVRKQRFRAKPKPKAGHWQPMSAFAEGKQRREAQERHIQEYRDNSNIKGP
ncbi:uncharacterized protein LOC117586164 [Drosophila guanche]|uniref:Uncharacterized protein n=1 Tax=Drosophila guanche TaxID=7266 RepID=A0A3B0JR23_DROGU|nr:uncharacterized protein LOC117586164 [Drosophila guanche]SPP84575.1 Hypothetical predicted protein [Drosophila guanche]